MLLLYLLSSQPIDLLSHIDSPAETLTMHYLRPLTRPRATSPLLNLLIRCYSAAAAAPQHTPCITVTDIPAPSTGRIRILSLNRPAARNAISRQLMMELRQHVDAVHAEYAADGSEVPPPKVMGGAAGVDQRGPTRAVILASEVDSCFCAGADLKERAGFTQDEYVPL